MKTAFVALKKNLPPPLDISKLALGIEQTFKLAWWPGGQERRQCTRALCRLRQVPRVQEASSVRVRRDLESGAATMT